MSQTFTLDAIADRLTQAKVLIQAAKAKAAEPGERTFEDIMAALLQEVLDNPWVDEELEANIRSGWATTLGNVRIVNDPDADDEDEDEDDDSE
jgi:hypothetical protein